MNILEHALQYAENGYAVFPVHGIEGGRCTCGKQECNSPGKHPIHSGGFKNATTDAGTISDWWRDHPRANVAIATGEVSGIMVVDVDYGPGGDGFISIADLELENGRIPSSARVRTGSGGMHIYLKMPDRPISSSAGKLGPSIDIRANNGYVVAPPSTHISGNTYEWKTPNV